MKMSKLRMLNPVTTVLAGCYVVLLMAGTAARADYNIPARMAWWSDARFGMFIQFGSYSYHANGEWAFAIESWSKTNYQTQVSGHFNPANFNATAIVSAAKAAGMRYIVITAKHHEGFAMWHSQVPSFTDVTGTKLYNLYDYVGFHRDLLMELKNTCDAQGIKFCLYYSIIPSPPASARTGWPSPTPARPISSTSPLPQRAGACSSGWLGRDLTSGRMVELHDLPATAAGATTPLPGLFIAW